MMITEIKKKKKKKKKGKNKNFLEVSNYACEAHAGLIFSQNQ